MIRSCFGGAAENFVVSGSEGSYIPKESAEHHSLTSTDAKIYIWHKENGQNIEALRGHGPGCVNAVSWNPVNAGMFASAGDDRKVRM